MGLFKNALPIWLREKEDEIHLRVQFKTILGQEKNCMMKVRQTAW